MKIPFFILMTLLASVIQPYVYAAIKNQVMEYRDGDTVLEGYLAYDETIKKKFPWL